jgi:proline iminopeptidase
MTRRNVASETAAETRTRSPVASRISTSFAPPWPASRAPAPAAPAAGGVDDASRVLHGPRAAASNTTQIVIVPARLFLADAFKGLSSSDRTVVFYDMRNRGRSQHISDVSAITIENDVRDLEAVRKHFKAQRFATIGYSYLGLMVVVYAMQHPDRIDRIVQLGPVPVKFGTAYPSEFDNTRDRSVFDDSKWKELQRLEKNGEIERRPRQFCEREWDFMRAMLVAEPPRHLDRVASHCGMPNEWPVNLRKHFQARFSDSIAKLDVSGDAIAQLVTMPVLTIHGRKDRNAPYGAGREWAQLLPNARLLTLDNAAHNSSADEPKIVLSAVNAFFAGAWPSAAKKVR